MADKHVNISSLSAVDLTGIINQDSDGCDLKILGEVSIHREKRDLARDNRLDDFTGGERHDCVEEEDGIGCDDKSGRISSVGAGRDDVLIICT